MTYTKTILCLACSRREGEYCIAGKQVLEDGRFGSWVRPIFSEKKHGLECSAIRYDNGKLPKLLDYMEIPFVKRLPGGDNTEYQVENELIDPSKRWSCHGVADWQTVKNQYDKPDSLWGETDKVSERTAKNLKSSLMLIRPKSPIYIKLRQKEQIQARAIFQYRSMPPYNFSVTDINYAPWRLPKPSEITRALLCISLGGLFKNRYAYKLVAGIITPNMS